MEHTKMKYYDMTGTPGKCFIYSFGKFNNPTETLDWSADTKKIRDVFEELGYKVDEKCDISKKLNLLEDLKQFADENHDDENSFICFIMTHGCPNNTLITSDREPFNLEELIQLVDASTTLKGKPKIFVVTACRGVRRDSGQTSNQHDIASKVDDHFSLLPTRPDFLIILPASPNHVTFHFGGQYGTTFIDMLTTAISRHGKRSTMTELLQRLIYSMNCVPVWFENKLRIQVPCYISTMQKPFVLSKVGEPINEYAKLQIKYSEEDGLRTRIQALLQHAIEEEMSIYDDSSFSMEEEKRLKFSDYCYLLDESSGCYDTRQNRSCVVINAVSNAGAFGIANNDADMVVKDMTDVGFNVQKFPKDKDKDRTHSTLMKSIKKATQDINREVSCLFCFILVGSDSFVEKRKELNEFMNTFKNDKQMLNKPKVFIIQTYKPMNATNHISTLTMESYQLNDYDLEKHPRKFSVDADVMIIQACHEGCSERSSFLQCFCTSYKENRKTIPIVDMLVDLIPNKYGDTWNNLKVSFTSSMTKHLVLCDSFTEYTTADEPHRKTYIKNLQCIAHKLLTRIKEKETVFSSPSATVMSTAHTYQKILFEEDEKLKKINTYRRLIASDYLVIVAIDFGTTFSGFAWSMRSELEDYQHGQCKSDVPPISISQNWNSPSQNAVSLKTPTCLLLDAEKEFRSFGYKAENEYVHLAREKSHQRYYFFQRFKMVLHEDYTNNRYIKILRKMTQKIFSLFQSETNEPSSRFDQMKITEMNGKTLPANEVFSKSIKALVGSFKEIFERDASMIKLKDKDIKWVLTVPAIWSERSKQFMRKCAELAGIPTDSLTIALEPECASVYCQYLTAKHWKTDEENFSFSTTGRKYMIVDLGGGTVDIAVHEILEEQKFKEIYRTTGTNCGGNSIDNAFLDFLKSVFDKPFKSLIDLMKTNYPEEYLDVFRNFELKKRTYAEKEVRMTFPTVVFTELCGKIHNQTVEQVFEDSEFHNYIKLSKDKLKISSVLFSTFFTPTLDKILNLLETILSNGNMSDVTDILLVGGFAECGILQDRIKSKFKQRRVSIPHDCGLAVLKGAVLFGHSPSYIAVRLIRFTYGVQIYGKFDEALHPKSRLVEIGGVKYCKDMFDTLIERNTEIRENTVVTKNYCTRTSKQEKILLNIYMSTDQNPDFVDHSSCLVLGKLDVHISNPTERMASIGVNFSFGETELKVTATDCETGQLYHTTIDMVAEM